MFFCTAEPKRKHELLERSRERARKTTTTRSSSYHDYFIARYMSCFEIVQHRLGIGGGRCTFGVYLRKTRPALPPWQHVHVDASRQASIPFCPRHNRIQRAQQRRWCSAGVCKWMSISTKRTCGRPAPRLPLHWGKIDAQSHPPAIDELWSRHETYRTDTRQRPLLLRAACRASAIKSPRYALRRLHQQLLRLWPPHRKASPK